MGGIVVQRKETAFAETVIPILRFVMSDSRWSDWESLTQQQQSYLLLAGYPEEELKNADSDFLDALLLDMPSRAGDMPGFVSAPHSSISQSQRCFVVSNPDVESSNEAFVYVHGVMDGLQTQVTSRALSNGSNMWLGKLELGNDIFCRALACGSHARSLQGYPLLLIALMHELEKLSPECKGTIRIAVAPSIAKI